ncbi:EpsG family protein [Psychrobacter faecalis]|uniref:EpsG family protein n=1 Tax=Psychrobacter faecalis TaxID=180588 RepID=UPI003FD0341B
MSGWNKENKKDAYIKCLLFLFSPFVAFLYSLRTVKKKSSYFIFYLTAVFFGLAFSLPSGRDGSGPSYDGQAYRKWFDEMKYISFQDYFEDLQNYLTFNSLKRDFYFDTFAFYVSRITDNYHVMFMLAAVIFAYFTLKSLSFLTKEERFDNGVSSYILLYLFTYNQIFNINGMRFWTAAWIAVFCIFKLFRDKNNKYLILILITPFIHGSYWLFIGVVAVAYMLRRFDRLWVLLFLSSFFTSIFAAELLQYIQSFLPSFLSNSIDVYTDPEYIEFRRSWSGIGFFKILIENSRLIYMNFVILLFIRHSNEIKINIKTKDLYLFLLIFVTVFNFLMTVPSLGGRYITLSYPVIAYIWLVSFKGRRYSWVLVLLPFFFIYQIYIQILKYTEVTTYDFYISSPFYLLYKYLFSISQ